MKNIRIALPIFAFILSIVGTYAFAWSPRETTWIDGFYQEWTIVGGTEIPNCQQDLMDECCVRTSGISVNRCKTFFQHPAYQDYGGNSQYPWIGTVCEVPLYCEFP